MERILLKGRMDGVREMGDFGVIFFRGLEEWDLEGGVFWVLFSEVFEFRYLGF